MFALKHLARKIKEWLWPAHNTFSLEVDTLQEVFQLAEREGRTPDEIVQLMVSGRLRDQEMQMWIYRLWDSLNDREQTVTALMCRDYSRTQIAQRLGLAPSTVKTYMERIYQKLGVKDLIELRLLFKDWDFSEWE